MLHPGAAEIDLCQRMDYDAGADKVRPVTNSRCKQYRVHSTYLGRGCVVSEKTEKRNATLVRLRIRASTGDQYTAVFAAEDDAEFAGYFNAHIVELPGCLSYGENLATARKNLREALELYISS